MTKKFYLLAALGLVLIVSGGIYAYSYTTAIWTIGITAPTGDIATVNATATQPDWDDVLTPVTDEITYRPNAIGDVTNIKYQYPASGDHWDKVDETSSDETIRVVFTLADRLYESGSIRCVTWTFFIATYALMWPPPRPWIPATAMRIVSLAPSTLPDDLVPATVNVAPMPAAPAAARFKNVRRVC